MSNIWHPTVGYPMLVCQIFDARVSDIWRIYKYFLIDNLFSDCCPTHLCEMLDDVRFWVQILLWVHQHKSSSLDHHHWIIIETRSSLDHHQNWIIIKAWLSLDHHHHHCLCYLNQMVLSSSFFLSQEVLQSQSCRHTLHVGPHQHLYLTLKSKWPA